MWFSLRGRLIEMIKKSGHMESGFKETCVARLNQVLYAHGFTDGAFEDDPEGLQYLRRAIHHAGRDYRIEVYDGLVVMHAVNGGYRYECYLREEFASGEAQIEGFARRLDRFLGGGAWEGPDEGDSLVDELIAWLRRFFRR